MRDLGLLLAPECVPLYMGADQNRCSVPDLFVVPVCLEMLRSFRLRLIFFFGGLTLILGGALVLYVNHVASANLTQASGEALQSLGRSASLLLARTLAEREREVLLLSRTPLLVSGQLHGAALQKRFDEIKASYPHYAWIGLADTEGRVISSGDGLLLGQSVAQRPWYQVGRGKIFVGDVHKAVLLSKLLQPQADRQPLRFLDFAAPVLDPQGSLRGVVATHVHWSWVKEMLGAVLGGAPASQGVEALILGKDGEWLHPFERIGTLAVPADLPADGTYRVVNWGDAGLFLTSRTRVEAGTGNELGWQIILRQPKSEALAPVSLLQRNLLMLGGATFLVGVLLVYRLASGFSRPVEQLAKAAHVIERGDDTHAFQVQSPLREISNLAASLRGMTRTLLAQRLSLQESNAHLEQQVHARTLELQEANQALERLARQDALTGLSNRRAADERLQAEFLRVGRSGVGYALLLMDIDHFKRVNDTFGHEEGDKVLQHVASRLGLQVRSTDCVARFGGEEFLVILPATELDGALIIAEKIRRDVAAMSLEPVGQVTLSIGLALASPEDTDREAALRRADALLYRAKSEGRNRVVAAT